MIYLIAAAVWLVIWVFVHGYYTGPNTHVWISVVTFFGAPFLLGLVAMFTLHKLGDNLYYWND